MGTGCTEVAESLPVTFHAVKSQTDNYNLYTSWPQKPAFPTESGWVTYTTNTSNCTFLAEWAQGAAPWTVDGHSRLPEPLHNSVCELLAASKLVADFCRFVLICAELC